MGYQHTQIGTVIIIAVLGSTIAALLALALVPAPFPPIAIVVLAFVGVTLALFYSLTVEIQDNTLTCRFGVGIIRKHIPLSDVDHVQAVLNPWFVGWGIRWYPGKYWVWNVSGFRAVELVFKDGKQFRIGTDEPEALIRAIELAKKTHA